MQTTTAPAIRPPCAWCGAPSTMDVMPCRPPAAVRVVRGLWFYACYRHGQQVYRGDLGAPEPFHCEACDRHDGTHADHCKWFGFRPGDDLAAHYSTMLEGDGECGRCGHLRKSHTAGGWCCAAGDITLIEGVGYETLCGCNGYLPAVAEPNRPAWLAGCSKYGVARACVCCGSDAGDGARMVLVQVERTMGYTTAPTLDPSEPGDTYSSFAVCEPCAARLPAGHAQRCEDLVTVLAIYSALPEVRARRAAAPPAIYDRPLMRVA